MTPRQDHFSTFELDVHFANGRPSGSTIERHILECARCSDYLHELEELGRVPPRAVAPAASRLPGRTRMWAVPAAGALAVAAVAMIVARGRNHEEDAYVGIKGTPAVQVLVRSQDRSEIWDGRAPVHPGDALALRIACEGFTEVAVLTPAAGRWARVSQGVCPASGTPLPFTLVVDDAPGEERLGVVLSGRRLTDEALEAAAERELRNREVWAVRLAFPKAGGRR
jgi:hypothetical protein